MENNNDKKLVTRLAMRILLLERNTSNDNNLRQIDIVRKIKKIIDKEVN